MVHLEFWTLLQILSRGPPLGCTLLQYVCPLTTYEMLLAMSCITPVHSRAESNYRVQAFMKVKMCMKGKVWYYLGKSLPLDNLRRKEKQIVFWDGFYAGLEIEGSMMPYLKSFYSIPVLYIKYTRLREIRTCLLYTSDAADETSTV